MRNVSKRKYNWSGRYGFHSGRDREYYNSGFFRTVKYYKRPELIKPYLNYIDASATESLINAGLLNSSSDKMLNKIYKELQNKKLYNYSLSEFNKQIHEIWGEVSHTKLYSDIMNLFYNPAQNLEFEQRNDKNKFRYRLLDKINNPYIKITSQGDSLKSAIMTKYTVYYLLATLALLRSKTPSTEYNEALDQLKGNKNNDSEPLDTILNTMDSTQCFETAIEHGKNTISKMETMMSKEEFQKTWKDLTNGHNFQKAAMKIDSNYLNYIEKELRSIEMNIGDVKNNIKKLLDRSLSYFGGDEVTLYENFLDHPIIDRMQEMELLHPMLRKISLDDISVKETLRKNKINIYIDNSGSMDEHCGYRGLSKQTFSKALAVKLKELKLLDEVYTFREDVIYQGKDLIDIMAIQPNGGTSISNAVMHAEKNGRNAIIITDAEDSCHVYSDKVFFIGVRGARFSSFKEEVLKKYKDKEQIIIFTGTEVHKY